MLIQANAEPMKNRIKLSRGATLVLITITGVVGYYFATNSGQASTNKVSPTLPLSDDALKAATQSMRARHSDSASGDSAKMIDLGSKLFVDKSFSSNGEVACSTCHQPEASFTDSKPTSVGIAVGGMNTPTIINAYAGHWFFWNGRADSLEAQALGPVENPGEHGFSRGQVVRRLIEHYKTPYEALFGPIPPEATNSEQVSARPASKPARVSHEVAAYALATLGSPILQKSILHEAHSKSRQPVEILENMAAGATEKPTAFDQLPEARKAAIAERDRAERESTRMHAEAAAERDRAQAEQQRMEADQARAAQVGRMAGQIADGFSQLANGNLGVRLAEAFPPDFEQLRADFNATASMRS